MYKFMQIWGSCVDLYVLGENALKGPVDNLLTKNKKVIKLLVEDKYLEYIKTATFEETERPVGFEGDSPIAYDTPIVRIVHNNPLLERYIKRTEERCNRLKEFLAEVKTNKNYFLIYSLNSFDINRKTHKLKGKVLVENIEYLKSIGLLDKVIFIGTTGKAWTDFWSNDLIPLIKKYNLKYLEVDGLKSWIDTTKQDLETWHSYFIKEFKDIIKNGTNKKYYKKRDNTGKFINTNLKKLQKPNENDTKTKKQNYYLYF